MASNTRPFLMTGVALASAAAVVVATPAIVPSATTSPLMSASANYNLTTFSDIFTIPSGEWISALFQGYGGAVGPKNPTPSNPEETGGLEPWASTCDGGCFVAGLPGVTYLALDALINGNGEGWDDYTNWSVGALNYFYEGGPAAGTQWIAQSSVGAANPLLSVLITLLFTGPQLVTVVYDNALSLIADAALPLPLVGQYVFGSINAYLGQASQYVPFQGYTAGLSGVLNYWVDVVSGNAPIVEPTAPSAPSAALASAAAAPSARATATPEAAAPEVSATEVTAAKEAATEVTATESATEAGGSESAPQAGVETETVNAADAVADAAPAAGAEQAPAAPKGAAVAGKRPVRDAVAKVTKSIASALSGAKAAAPAPAPAETGTETGADAASSADSAS